MALTYLSSSNNTTTPTIPTSTPGGITYLSSSGNSSTNRNTSQFTDDEIRNFISSVEEQYGSVGTSSVTQGLIINAMEEYNVSSSDLDAVYGLEVGTVQSGIDSLYNTNTSAVQDITSLQTGAEVQPAVDLGMIIQSTTDSVMDTIADYTTNAQANMQTLLDTFSTQLEESMRVATSTETIRSGVLPTTTGETLSEQELDTRRDTVNSAYLGARQMRIGLASDGVAGGAETGLLL